MRSWLFILFPITAAVALSTTAAGAQWSYRSGTDELDDSRYSVAVTTIRRGFETYSITVRCQSGELISYVDFDDYLGSDGRPVRYRVDKEPPVSEEWLPSASGTAVFAASTIDFVNALARGNRVIIEAEDYRGVRHRLKFTLAGSGKRISAVLRDCEAQQRAKAQEPKPEKPINEEPISERLSSILKDVEKLKEEREANPPAPHATALIFEQQALARTIQAQIQRCWRIEPGAQEAADAIVEITVFFNQDGSVRRADIVDESRMRSDTYFRSAAENARRAILKCSPFDLPLKKYSIWKTVKLTLNLREMFGT